MVAVIGLLLLALSVLIFELLRIIPKLPGSPGWVKSAGTSTSAIIAVMGFFVTGLGLLARSLMDIKAQPLDNTAWAEAAVIVVVTGLFLRVLYRKRRLALAAPTGAVSAVVGAAAAAPAAGAANDGPGRPGAPAAGAGGKGRDTKRAA